MNSLADMSVSDLWTYLSHTDKPIVMYGMGNGADKILSVLDKYNVSVADFFASDGFVRGHSFHGKVVLSFDEIIEKYKDPIILLSFGSNLPEVLNRIYRLSEQYEFYAPDVPVSGDNLFTSSFYTDNMSGVESARALLADDLSKHIYDEVIRYKLSGRVEHLRSSYVSCDDVFLKLLTPSEYKTYVDLGAYNGDTIRQLISYGADPDRIIAFEPDVRSFRKLKAYADNSGTPEIFELYNNAVWSENTCLSFNNEGNRNSGVSASGKQVQALALDKITNAANADYMKFDVEGSEQEALLGSAEIIRSKKPDLFVSLYHRSEDIFSLIHLVHSLCPEYKLFVRRFEYVPAWDLSLIATVRNI